MKPEHKEIVEAIAYQINTPEITTMGACSNNCGRLARGGATCPDCLAGNDAELRALVRQLRQRKLDRLERCEREGRPWRG